MFKITLSQILNIIGVLQFVIFFIVGIAMGQPTLPDDQFDFLSTLFWWFGGFATGMLFIALAELINLLHRITWRLDDVSSATFDEVNLNENLEK